MLWKEGYLIAEHAAEVRTWVSAVVWFFVAIFYFAIRNCVMHFNMHVHCLRWPNAEGEGSLFLTSSSLYLSLCLSLCLYARVRTHRMWTSSELSLWCCCNQHTRALAMANWVNGTNVVSVTNPLPLSLSLSFYLPAILALCLLTPTAWRHWQTIKFNIQPGRERGEQEKCALHETICGFPRLICTAPSLRKHLSCFCFSFSLSSPVVSQKTRQQILNYMFCEAQQETAGGSAVPSSGGRRHEAGR